MIADFSDKILMEASWLAEELRVVADSNNKLHEGAFYCGNRVRNYSTGSPKNLVISVWIA
jgi:hypothetical protein